MNRKLCPKCALWLGHPDLSSIPHVCISSKATQELLAYRQQMAAALATGNRRGVRKPKRNELTEILRTADMPIPLLRWS